MEVVHMPVLLEECIELLAPDEGPCFMVDATQGEGGHSHAFLSRFPRLSLVGIDADAAIQAVARTRLESFGSRVFFHNGWSHDFFAAYPPHLPRPDRILIDLGVSVYHYEKSGRGFSFRKDEELDMRIDPSRSPSARDIVMNLDEKSLADLLYQNADERYSRRIARAIVEARSGHEIATSIELAGIVERAVPAVYRHGPIHAATRTFQALRIAVNGELDRLESLLDAALAVLAVGGRLGVISFHSIEDRIVKNFFRERNKDCICPPTVPICECGGERELDLVTRKAVRASEAESRMNPPSRSAQLRVVRKRRERRVPA